MAIFQPGTHIGNHVVVALRATGDVSEVYEAIAAGGRRRALKMLKVDASIASKLHARLAQEAEALARIEHVNVVRLHDVGIDLDRLWLLLELVEGHDLAELARLAGGALPEERAVSIIRQAAEGVAAAHALGILHRDLRPENILVNEDDLVKVGDFGSAKFTGWGVRTTSEIDLGSCLHMAPEFMKHRIAEPASDVYSLAIVLYEILAGENPIAPPSADALTICRRQIDHDPPPLASLGRDIQGDLSALVQQALSKDPRRRPTMRQFADGLAVVLHRLQARRRAAVLSLPLPGRDPRLALTELSMSAFDVAWPDADPPQAGAPPMVAGARVATAADQGGGAAALPAAAESAPPDPAASRPEAGRAPAPSPPRTAPMTTVRSPADPAAAPPAERSSSAVPVERAAPRPSHPSRALSPAVGLLIAVAVIGLAATGWLLATRGPVAPASAPRPTLSAMAPPAPPLSAAPSVTASATAPRPRASATPRHRAAPPRPRQPFP